MMANPTQAKDIAVYFYESKGWKIIPSQLAISIRQAKYLLDAGFSYDEIITGIDYYIKNPPRNGMKTLGYLNYALNEALDKIKHQQDLQQLRQQLSTPIVQRGEDNARKNERIKEQHSQSRLGKGVNLDLFEKS